MDQRHPFHQSADDARICDHQVSGSGSGGGWGGQTCGLPRSNAAVHAPGTTPRRPVLTLVPDLQEVRL